MKKFRIIFVLGVLAVLLVVATTAYSGQEKTDVCHITGTYDFGSGPVPIGHVINIADPAYQSHIDHGDPAVWNVVTLEDGTEVCTAGASESKTVFITSQAFNGALGGLDGADDKCQAAADAAGLGGTYKAWLSDSNGSPSTRFTHSAVPYVDTMNTIIANNWADLTTLDVVDGITTIYYLQNPICTYENGEFISGSQSYEDCNNENTDDYGLMAWTNTYPDGTLNTAAFFSCNDWMSSVYSDHGNLGKTGYIRSAWTVWADTTCDNSFHLFCFEQ
ncbi:MAG: hypothetical protein U9R58_02640 [Chloroflexota bacterium]|nr:hypothetical protein [Chloroflexota bacterium]